MIQTLRTPAGRPRYTTHCVQLEHAQITELRRLAELNDTSVSALMRAAVDWLVTHPRRFRLTTTPNASGTMPNVREG